LRGKLGDHERSILRVELERFFIAENLAQRYYLTSKNRWRSLMSSIATTKLSSKGQIVIPEEVRKELGLEPGAQFVVMGEGDVVILKKIEAPDRREFLALARKVRSQARKAGVKRSEIKKAVGASRRRG
jgi:AbrB family looped-hinge helix DNA binding protein